MAKGITTLIIFWLSALACGLGALLTYDNKPGEIIEPPAKWPVESGLALHRGKFNLVIFIHPKCFCSKASLAELAKLMGNHRSKLSARAMFYSPPEFENDESKGSLWDKAAAIPGLVPLEDINDKAANAFSAHTSGFVVLYTPQGKLKFWGGITSARAHEGDNTGLNTLSAILNDGKVVHDHTAVFGCHLSNNNKN